MAIYRLSVNNISRAKGQSAVNSAAYRHAEKYHDERLNQTFDYTRKKGVGHSQVFLPESAPEWAKELAKDPEKLWNAVESVEKRKDARVSKEIQLALPVELTPTERISLVEQFVKTSCTDRGMIADVVFHDEASHNPHVHIMLTTRELGEQGFGQKVREWNKSQLIHDWRSEWEVCANRALELANTHTRIDARSYACQGINLESQSVTIASNKAKDQGRNSEEMNTLVEIQRANGERILHDPTIALKALTQQQATFTERDLSKFLNTHTVDFEQFQLAQLAVKTSPELIALGRDPQGRARFTFTEMMDCEQQLFEDAGTLEARKNGCLHRSHAVKHGLVQEKVTEFGLSDDQARALSHLTDKGDIKALVGVAGAGKSYLLKAATEAWEASGLTVKGAALSGIVAENLGLDANIHESRTLHSWQYQWGKGRHQLSDKDVFVIDEAGLVGTRQLQQIVSEVASNGAKVVLIGDDMQLQAIDAGAAFRGLVERVGCAELNVVRRQTEEWQKDATLDFAGGRTKKGLNAYVNHDQVKGYRTEERAKSALIHDWSEQQHSTECLMLAHERRDVAELNRLARDVLCSNGQLDLSTKQSFKTHQGSREFCVGEKIIFLRNDNGLQVKNGTLGHIQALKANGDVLVKAQGNRDIRLNLRDYQHVDYGYACTVHKAQGVTVNNAFVYASQGFDQHLTYVAMTRHKDNVTLYFDKETFEHWPDAVERLSRHNGKDLVHDYQLQTFAERQDVKLSNKDQLVHQENVTQSLGLDSKQALKRIEAASSALLTQKEYQTSWEAMKNDLEALQKHFDKPVKTVHQPKGEIRGLCLGVAELGNLPVAVIQHNQNIQVVKLYPDGDLKKSLGSWDGFRLNDVALRLSKDNAVSQVIRIVGDGYKLQRYLGSSEFKTWMDGQSTLNSAEVRENFKSKVIDAYERHGLNSEKSFTSAVNALGQDAVKEIRIEQRQAQLEIQKSQKSIQKEMGEISMF